MIYYDLTSVIDGGQVTAAVEAEGCSYQFWLESILIFQFYQ